MHLSLRTFPRWRRGIKGHAKIASQLFELVLAAEQTQKYEEQVPVMDRGARALRCGGQMSFEDCTATQVYIPTAQREGNEQSVQLCACRRLNVCEPAPVYDYRFGVHANACKQRLNALAVQRCRAKPVVCYVALAVACVRPRRGVALEPAKKVHACVVELFAHAAGSVEVEQSQPGLGVIATWTAQQIFQDLFRGCVVAVRKSYGGLFERWVADNLAHFYGARTSCVKVSVRACGRGFLEVRLGRRRACLRLAARAPPRRGHLRLDLINLAQRLCPIIGSRWEAAVEESTQYGQLIGQHLLGLLFGNLCAQHVKFATPNRVVALVPFGDLPSQVGALVFRIRFRPDRWRQPACRWPAQYLRHPRENAAAGVVRKQGDPGTLLC